MKMHLIMPMGGGGTRFGNKGFNLPKPLIELQGTPFFYWATQSIVKYIDVEDIIFVVLQEHIDKFKIDEKIHEFYPEAIIQILPHMLNGAVLTSCEGVKAINDNKPLLFNDCDHAFLSKSFYDFINKNDFDKYDGGLLTFKSDSPNFSYVRFDEAKNVVGTVEKEVVSNEAICGAYYFKDKNVFSESVDAYLNNCQYKEFFMSGVYNELANKGGKITTFNVDEHISFGTPDEYDRAVTDSRLGELK